MSYGKASQIELYIPWMLIQYINKWRERRRRRKIQVISLLVKKVKDGNNEIH